MKCILFFFSFIISLSCAVKCPADPSFWCSSQIIAKLCGATEFCASHFQQSDSNLESVVVAPVSVEVYYESYCPDSIRFLTTMLYPTWKTLHTTGIMKVKLVPYGKATTSKDKETFKCQHGPSECYGNKIENCLIHHTDSDPTKYLPVIQCMETADDPDSAAPKCTQSQGLSWQTIEACANGSEGNRLLYEAGVLTHGLNPTLNWVPWIVVNNVHNQTIQDNAVNDLKKLVCDTYEGQLPQQCTGKEKVKFIPSVVGQ